MKNNNKSNPKALERHSSKSSQSSKSSNFQKLTLDKRLEAENLSPFLVDLANLPDLPSSASFVEYLRWMRDFKKEDSEQNKAKNNATKLHLLQIAQDSRYADYSKFLKRACQRIERIVTLKQGKIIKVTCPWRIRVGGHRGPESILLPAFDALGIPFIPSSTLRGIARNQAIREVMKNNNLTWKDAEKHETIISHFGSLEARDKSNRESKVTFLDAYPYPVDDKSPSGGLALDIANNIWKWGENNLPDYQPNPNLFLSLKQATFLIGIIPNLHCQNGRLEQVKEWLIKGLAIGAGSQINSGYGCLTESGKYEIDTENILLALKFTLEGQLINSYKSYDQSKLSQPYKIDKIDSKTQKININSSTNDNPEVRPIAFKSMLRYWFRVIALGVLIPQRVKELESFIFGGIEPKHKHRGLIQVQIQNSHDGKSPTKDNYGKQSGELILLASSELSSENYQLLTDFIQVLTWFLFHLGGVGLGGRRPLHKHSTKPFWRGTNLKAENQDEIFSTPRTIENFKIKFKKNLGAFYKHLDLVQLLYIQSMQQSRNDVQYHNINNCNNPFKVDRQKGKYWTDALDTNCRVLVYRKTQNNNFQKGFTLCYLHSDMFNNEEDENLNSQQKNRFLCGENGISSPIWITALDQYEIVTIFNATNLWFLYHHQENSKKIIKINPRYQYFTDLTDIEKQGDRVEILWDQSGLCP